LLEKILVNSSTESIAKLLDIVHKYIIERKLLSGMTYTYYTPETCDNDAIIHKPKKLQFIDEIKFHEYSQVAYHDLESKTVYLRIPCHSIDSFKFVCRYQGELIEIPSDAFKFSRRLRQVSDTKAVNSEKNDDDDDDDDGNNNDASWGSPGIITMSPSIAHGWNGIYSFEDIKSIDSLSTSSSVENVKFHKEIKLQRESPKFDSMYSILSIPHEYEDDYDDFN
jgi:hypothetical protein